MKIYHPSWVGEVAKRLLSQVIAFEFDMPNMQWSVWRGLFPDIDRCVVDGDATFPID